MSDNDDNKLLHQAALFDNVELMESLLIGSARNHIDEHDIHGSTPLHISIMSDSLKCCHLLLMAGANPNIPCSGEFKGMTPLHVAARENKEKFLELLLEYGASVDLLDGLGRTPVDVAIHSDSFECRESLQMHIDLQSIKNIEIESTFFESCKLGNVQMARGIVNSSNFTPKMIQTLINTSTEQDHDLLYCVCRAGHAEMCEYLLSLGAEVRVEPMSGLSPVHIACLVGHLDCVDVLLKAYPFQVTVPTAEGSYPLHLASMQGHLEVAKLIVTILLCHSGRLDPDGSLANETFASALNFRDSKGSTCLHLAVECGAHEVVRYLLGLRKPAAAGGRARTDSIPGGHKTTSCLLHVDAVDDDGKTALHLSVLRHGSGTGDAFLKISKLLLEHGANPNIKFDVANVNNRKESSISTPLLDAVKRGDLEMVGLLLQFGAKDESQIAAKLSIQSPEQNMIEMFLANLVTFDAGNMVSLEGHTCTTCQSLKSSAGNKSGRFTNGANSYPGMRVDWGLLGLATLKPSWLLDSSIDCKLGPGSFCPHLITELDLSHNLLSELPFFIWNLGHLRKLCLSNNQIEKIRVRKSASKVKILNTNEEVYNSESAIIQLDVQEFAENSETASSDGESHDSSETLLHKHLEELDLKCNKLKSIPGAIFGIQTLKRLNLSFNKITSLPADLWNCTSLVELDASHNLLPDLPHPRDSSSVFCGDCNSKEEFASRGNSLSSDDGFQENEFVDLCYSHVNHWQDRVKVQPPYFIDGDDDDATVIKSTSHLKNLDLSFNLFEEVPQGLPCLAYRLEKLFLSNNQITRFGSVQNYPMSLEVLDLSRNQLSEEHQVRRMSSALSSSSLSSVKICKSPRCLTNSYSPSNSPLLAGCRLTTRCSFNGISNFSLPSAGSTVPCSHACHTQLPKLKMLLLTFNCLKTFSFCCREDYGNNAKQVSSGGDVLRTPTVLFPNLITLDLSNNLISTFPKEVGYLRNLTTLTMTNNRITELPKEVGFLRKLWSLNFSGNPVNETLKSLLGEKMRVVKSVVSYMRSIMDEVVPFNHLKLMVVGKQGTGKTSLLQMLQDGKNSKSTSRREQNLKGKDNSSGENLSTLGVDIGELVMKRENEEVIFSTWDFGGQSEYYATHQYFLTRRSVYLLVWRITDGERGINEIFRWLINIQARAPSSCVIIIGTHLDAAFKTFPVKFLEDMTDAMERRYVKLVEPGRWGFPKVLGHVMVTCKPGMMAKSNHQRLHEIIWKAVDATLDNTGLRLLDQKVPVNYIHLQKTIKAIADARKESGNDPVLTSDQYKQLVIETMEENFGASFQDLTELNQATQFLHENGFLLHYDDSNLRDIYFLDPQWLCDMLACVVTVKQINGLKINGVMKLDDLMALLKGVAFKMKDIEKYTINLLHKFEVALQWDDVHLLIPSLLPLDKVGVEEFVMIPVTSEESPASGQIEEEPKNPLSGDINNPLIFRCGNPSFSFFRLYTMSYFPSGFWPRLITRMLGDVSYCKLVRSLYDLSVLSNLNVDAENLPGSYWHCWQTGLELRHLGLPVLRVKEISSSTSPGIFDYSKYNPVMKDESDYVWYSVLAAESSILEVVVYNESFGLRPCDEEASLTIFPRTEVAVRLLTVVVEQIDTLLEDWYPSVGTRFTKDIKGAMLINRLVPCTKCLTDQEEEEEEEVARSKDSDRAPKENLHKRDVQSSRPAGFLRDSDSPDRVVYCFSIEHCIHVAQSNKVVSCPRHGNLGPYCTADETGHIQFSHVAPDTVFYDLPGDLVIPPDDLQRTKFLGKGAFGAVYVGLIHLKKTKGTCPVAVKLLRPIIPEEEIPLDLYRLFQKECDLWARDPVLKCCEAYMVARKEMSILLDLKHDHVVSLVGICVSPPCLVLSLAPLGCLSDHLRSFRKAGLRLHLYAVRDVIVQVASALGYLHSKHIIYRDLKSENILVWSFPDCQVKNSFNPVDVKLADYGVSRVFSPTGTKGYAGTLPFMAPEILVQNGEEIYTEKVDCYSFSLLIYELLSLKMPYEGDVLLGTCGINLKSHVLAGGRPVLSLKEAQRPTNVLDLMTLCWSSDPQERLSAAQIEAFARRPEFCSLLDAVKLSDHAVLTSATSVKQHKFIKNALEPEQEAVSEIVMFGMDLEKGKPKTGSLYVYAFSEDGLGHVKKLNTSMGRVVSMCSTNGYVWCATDQSMVHIYRFPDYSELVKFSVAEPPTGITCICEVENGLCVVLDTGVFVLCSLSVGRDQPSNVDITVVQYPGNGKLVHCILHSSDSDRHFLWSGQTQGSLLLWELADESFRLLQTLHHAPSEFVLSDTVQITSESQHASCFFTYVYPGSVVYKWNAKERCIEEKIDLLSHLHSVEKSSKAELMDCTVACMTVAGGMLYVGTSTGLLLGFESRRTTCSFICRSSAGESIGFLAILPLFQFHEQGPESRGGPVSRAREMNEAGSAPLEEEGGERVEKCQFAVITPKYTCLKDAVVSASENSSDRNNFYVLAWSDEVFRQSSNRVFDMT